MPWPGPSRAAVVGPCAAAEEQIAEACGAVRRTVCGTVPGQSAVPSSARLRRLNCSGGVAPQHERILNQEPCHARQGTAFS